MMKFFRKHNRKLLAIATAFLMMAFVGGSAFEQMLSRQAGANILGTTTHGVVRQDDLQQARYATNILAGTGVNWFLPWSGAGEPLAVIDWLLLVREANRLGAIPSLAATRQTLTQAGQNENFVRSLAAARDIAPESIYTATADHLGVLAVLSGVLSPAKPSEAEVRRAARDEMEKVSIQAVALRASDFVDQSAEFDDAEITEFFERFKARDAGAGLTFGYRVPARVQAQYIKIDLNKIADQIRIGESTLEQRARDYWVANKTAAIFKRPPSPETEEPIIEPEPAEAEEPEGDNAEDAEPETPKTPESPYYTTFDEARDSALGAVRKDFGAKRAKELADQLLAAVLEPWYAIEAGDDGYQTASAEVAELGYYQKVLDRMPPSARYRDALGVVTGELFVFADARDVPSIGSSRTTPPAGTPRLNFSNAVFNVQGIVEMPDDRDLDRSQFLALHQTYPSPLTDNDGHTYLFRVVAVNPAHTPTDVADHRDQVIDDLKLQRGFDQAVAQAERLAEDSREAGLASAWQAAEALQAQATSASLLTPVAFPREGFPGFAGVSFKAFITNIGAVGKPFMDACFGLSELETDRLRITTIEMRDSGDPMVVVAQWLSTQPVYKDTFLIRRVGIAQRIRSQRQQRLAAEWLDSDNIRARAGYEPKQS